MTRAEKLIILLMGCSHALSHGYMLIFPAVLMLLKKEFAIGYLGLGFMGNVMGFTYGLGALPGGLIYNRLGPRKIYLICFLGSAAASLFIGASRNLFFLAVGLGFLGALGSIYHPLANSLITSKVREYGRGLGIHGAAGNIGMSAAPFIAGLIASAWGWRHAYLWFAVPGIAFSLWALSIDMSGGKSKETPVTTAGLKEYFSLPLCILYATNTLNTACFFGSVTFLPAFLAQRTSFHLFSMDSVAVGGLLSGVVLFTGVFGQLSGGILAQRKRPERNFFIICAVCFPLLLALSFAANLLLLLLAVVYFFLNFALQPMNNSLLANHTAEEMRGTAFGIYFSISFGLGSVAATLTGYIAQQVGLQWVFVGLSAAGVFMLVLAGFLERTRLRGFERGMARI